MHSIQEAAFLNIPKYYDHWKGNENQLGVNEGRIIYATFSILPISLFR
jgi:hypothetical protein